MQHLLQIKNISISMYCKMIFSLLAVCIVFMFVNTARANCNYKHDDFSVSGVGVYSYLNISKYHESDVNLGACGLTPKSGSNAYDNWTANNLQTGNYKVTTTAGYGGSCFNAQTDEHIKIKSKDDSVIVNDLGGPTACPSKPHEIKSATRYIDVCDNNGWIKITAYSQKWPAVRSLDLTNVKLERIGNAVSCPSALPPPIPMPSLQAPIISDVIVKCSDNKIEVQYNKTKGAKGYKIYRCEGSGCTPTYYDFDNAPNYSDKGLLIDNKVYGYAIRATDGVMDSPMSSIVYKQYACVSAPTPMPTPSPVPTPTPTPLPTPTPTPLPTPLPTPIPLPVTPLISSLNIGACVSNSIPLTWSNAIGASDYHVYRCSDLGKVPNCVPTTQIASPANLSHADNNLLVDLSQGTTFSYVVKGHNHGANVYGLSSNIASATCLPLKPNPVTITADRTLVLRGDAVIVSWTSSGAVSCTVSNQSAVMTSGKCNDDPQSCNGSTSFTINNATSFEITCTNAGGTQSAFVDVKLLPNYTEV